MADALLRSSPLALSLLDRELRFVAVNPAAAAINGVSAQDHVGRPLGEVLPALESTIGPALRRVVDTGEALIDDEVEGETPARPGVRRWWRVHWLPVREGDHVLGVAALFHEITVEVELRRARDELLAREHEVALELQRRLLPTRLPDIPDCEVAARYLASGTGLEVGGDFHDVVDHGRDGCWLAMVGDILGKGPEAAAMTAVVRHTIRAIAKRGDDAQASLRAANDALLTQEDLQLCSVICASIEPRAHDGGVDVRTTAAGHPPALVVRVDGRVEDASTHGSLLGHSADLSLTSQDTTLRPGDTLLLYTDGITDVPTRDGGRGEAALRALLTREAQAPLADLLEAVERLAREQQPGEPRDDIAVLGLRVR